MTNKERRTWGSFYQSVACLACGLLTANHWHSASLGWIVGLALMTLSPDFPDVEEP